MARGKKILIIGAKGMLGTDLAKVFEDYEPILWDQKELDITSEEQVNSKIAEQKPDIVINSAAFTAVDECETKKDICMKVNGDAVGFLAKACKKVGAILVHYSTDYVFNGEKKDGYDETYDKIEPLNVYGESKALGEKLLQENTDKYYLIRTSWLFGKNGKNFVETMLQLAGKNDSLKVVNDQFGFPTYTHDLAMKTRDIIEKKEPFGIYHVTNTGKASWCDFAKEIFKQKGISIKVEAVTSDEFPRPAKRPHYSMLKNTKLKPMQSWQDALTNYLFK